MQPQWQMSPLQTCNECVTDAASCCAGIAVYSRRATPLAAWTSGLEVANVVADADRACLVLETGVNQRWRYGNYRRSAENTADARAWEAAKIAAR